MPSLPSPMGYQSPAGLPAAETYSGDRRLSLPESPMLRFFLSIMLSATDITSSEDGYSACTEYTGTSAQQSIMTAVKTEIVRFFISRTPFFPINNIIILQAAGFFKRAAAFAPNFSPFLLTFRSL